MLTVVTVPLLANTFLTFVLTDYSGRVEDAARQWVTQVPGASVTGVESQGLSMEVMVQTPGDLPATSELLTELDGDVPDIIGIAVQSTQGSRVVVRAPGG
jgi:hypothetical protein